MPTAQRNAKIAAWQLACQNYMYIKCIRLYLCGKKKKWPAFWANGFVNHSSNQSVFVPLFSFCSRNICFFLLLFSMEEYYDWLKENAPILWKVCITIFIGIRCDSNVTFFTISVPSCSPPASLPISTSFRLSFFLSSLSPADNWIHFYFVLVKNAQYATKSKEQKKANCRKTGKSANEKRINFEWYQFDFGVLAKYLYLRLFSTAEIERETQCACVEKENKWRSK